MAVEAEDWANLFIGGAKRGVELSTLDGATPGGCLDGAEGFGGLVSSGAQVEYSGEEV